ncbi:MAG: mechanosensitive ion channel [Proteobacteria bacterium]|nr:MAG: mechanosensitive ion channel [Pseudomonadota bacterium]
MEQVISVGGTQKALQIFGIKLVGVDADNGKKLLLTLVFIGVALLFAYAARALLKQAAGFGKAPRFEFWAKQAIKLTTAVIIVIGVASVWFDDPARLTTALGLVTAGLAFALQKVVSAIAGYFIILRGKMFNVGDRITMGGVRGDVIALDFTKTTLMEMGQPPSVQSSEPAMWVKSRQYTGRVVSISNSKIFDEPVYNYTRDFPFLWEEITIPITYQADRSKAEEILLAVAKKHTDAFVRDGSSALAKMQEHFHMRGAEVTPRVYYRLTDNWLELALRFLVKDHGIRELKDSMYREILNGFDEAKIGIASATYEIVGFPPLRYEAAKPPVSENQKA